MNDSATYLAGIAALDRHHPNLLGIDLLPYHNIGNGKYALRLDQSAAGD